MMPTSIENELVASPQQLPASQYMIQTTAGFRPADQVAASITHGRHRQRRIRRQQQRYRRHHCHERHEAPPPPRHRVILATIIDAALEMVDGVFDIMNKACSSTRTNPSYSPKHSHSESTDSAESQSDSEQSELKDATDIREGASCSSTEVGVMAL